MEYFAIIDNYGRTIATASDIVIVEKYLDDVKNHLKYKERKRKLELERRTFMNKNKPVDPGVMKNSNNKELQNLRDIIKKNPSLKKFLEPELKRLEAIVLEEKIAHQGKRNAYVKAVENLQASWFETLSETDQYIWEGNWDHASEGYVPGYKKIQFLG